MKEFGFLLIALAVIQSYLWIFGIINLYNYEAQGAYFCVIIIQFISGLLAAKIIKAS
tara:strand:- start:271 stop:441 length:171 start_codon:yes stop_codon:yes gene_type:complete